ncbi:MAG: cytochrome-c peroxidase [Bacteroidia bacterium]
MKRLLLFIAVLFMAFKSIGDWKLSVPKGFPRPEQKTELNKNQIELGRMLFYDPALSANNMVSCASCHSPYNAFAHTDHALSHGIDDRIGKRNAPALMNLAWRKDFMWDGAFRSLEEQVAFPIDHPDEMGSSIDSMHLKLQPSIYGHYFAAAYGDPKITPSRISHSISSFLLTLVSSQSKYDAVQQGKAHFTDQEQKGYTVFKNNCNTCHQEPLFTTSGFAKNGLPLDTNLKDFGRLIITKLSTDSLRFRIPTLRNIEHTYPYMHDGRFKSLWQVIDHYNQASDLSGVKGNSVDKIQLNVNEKVDLMAFLLTLTDKEFLFNPAHAYPKSNFEKQLTNINDH